jgi:tetratricopeptide (TPR) repeat protein
MEKPFFAVILFSILILGCASTPKELFDRGEVARKNEDYAKAIKEYTKAINKDQDYADAYRGRGFAYLIMGKRELARNDFNIALGIEPDGWNAVSSRDALGYCSVPTSAYFAFRRGVEAANNKKDYDLAINELNVALEISSGFAAAYNGRGVSYLRKGNNSDDSALKEEYYILALSDFNESLKYYPENYEALANIGSVYLIRKDYDRAEDYINASLKIYPDFSYAKNLLEANKRDKVQLVRIDIPQWVKMGMSLADIKRNLPGVTLIPPKQNEGNYYSCFPIIKSKDMHRFGIDPQKGLVSFQIAIDYDVISLINTFTLKYGQPFFSDSGNKLWNIDDNTSKIKSIRISIHNSDYSYLNMTYFFENYFN